MTSVENLAARDDGVEPLTEPTATTAEHTSPTEGSAISIASNNLEERSPHI